MENFDFVSGKKLTTGEIIFGELIIYKKFCTAFIVPIGAENISDGHRVDYFSIEPVSRPEIQA